MPFLHKERIARLSRDRGFLVQASLLIVGASVVLAFLASLVFAPKGSLERMAEQIVAAAESEPEIPTTVSEFIYFVRYDTSNPAEPEFLDCRNLVRESSRDWSVVEMEKVTDSLPSEIIEPWLRGLRSGEAEFAIEILQSADEEQRYRDEFLGDLYFLNGDWLEAMEHYEAEANRFPESSYARRSAVILAMREGKLDELNLPDIESVFRPVEMLEIYAEARDLGALAVATVRVEFDMLTSRYLVPAIFSAAIWWAVFMGFWRPDRTRLIAAALAFGAGILSAFLTLYVVILQEQIQGFVFNAQDPAISQFLNLVAGVALREETLKLLCFAPFAFWTARRRSGIEAILLAGIVGLGFAFQENLQYFQNGAGTFIAWGRLLTANALHFSLTGVAGFYLYRMIFRKMHGWEEFLACFIAVVFVHGIYNAMFLMTAVAEYATLHFIVIALIAYQFFDRLRSQMDTDGIARRVSPLGIFVLGSVVLTSVVLVSSSTMLPFRFALGAFASSVASSVVLAFAFISRFRDL